jgi:glutathionylspermidine synthase
MRRETVAPRPNWQARVEELGLTWHTPAGQPYWTDDSCFVFERRQIADIQAATAELYRLFLEAGQRVIDENRLDEFGIPAFCHEAIRASWDSEPPALNYGRFDLGYDGSAPPKLFEFNCDTPTSLLEAAVVQWDWKEAQFPDRDQYNGIHEHLVDKFRDIAPWDASSILYFAHVAGGDYGEDMMTITYMRDAAREAGIASEPILMSDLGWDSAARRFVDLQDRPMDAIFHLYPWEWMVNEAFGRELIESLESTYWIEPIWKMIWSNKAILPLLWEMFPDHPNLLAASRGDLPGDHVRKPILAREGANVTIVRGGSEVASSGGDYGSEGYITQALFDLPCFDGRYPVIGSWIVDGEPAGMGIREDGLITGNTARFVPHVIG